MDEDPRGVEVMMISEIMVLKFIMDNYNLECKNCQTPITAEEIIYEEKKSYSLRKHIYSSHCVLCNAIGEIIQDLNIDNEPIFNGAIVVKSQATILREADIIAEALNIIKTSAERKQQE